MAPPSSNNSSSDRKLLLGEDDHGSKGSSFDFPSPRSVLERRALSGLALALAEERKRHHQHEQQQQQQDAAMVLTTPRCVNAQALRMVVAKHGNYNTVKDIISSASLSQSSSSSCHTQPLPILRTPSLCRSFQESRLHWSHLLEPDARCSSSSSESIFYSSPPTCNPHIEHHTPADDNDFLSACFFCKRFLAVGQDVYMYRGDRAFCSAECRYEQIVVDERREARSA